MVITIHWQFSISLSQDETITSVETFILFCIFLPSTFKIPFPHNFTTLDAFCGFLQRFYLSFSESFSRKCCICLTYEIIWFRTLRGLPETASGWLLETSKWFAEETPTEFPKGTLKGNAVRNPGLIPKTIIERIQQKLMKVLKKRTPEGWKNCWKSSRRISWKKCQKKLFEEFHKRLLILWKVFAVILEINSRKTVEITARKNPIRNSEENFGGTPVRISKGTFKKRF